MRLLRRGQSLVEFALILPVLLLVFFAIIDGALIVQGLLTVNHAARQAARFATTYQPVQGECLKTYRQDPMPNDYPYCGPNNEGDAAYYDRRVALIKEIAQRESLGLRIMEICDTDACFSQPKPGIFGTQVRGFMSFDDAEETPNKPGLPGLPVRVDVIHHVPLVFFNIFSTKDYFRAVGSSEMINEGVQAGQGNVPPPTIGAPPLPAPPLDPPPTVVVTPEGTETPTPTPGPGDVVVTLNFETAVNVLPDAREHAVIAHVTLGGENVSNRLVQFTLDNGSFALSGSEAFQSEVAYTDANGNARVNIYANEPMAAQVEAWVDGNLNGIKDGAEVDTATKTWTAAGPYLVVSDHNPLPGSFIATLVKDHSPTTPYALWWCTDGADPDTVPMQFVVDSAVVVDTGSWSAEVTDIQVPEDAAGTYHMETHNAGGSCGATDLVARSGVITIKEVPPDLIITDVQIVNPPVNKRAPGLTMTVTVSIQNTQPVSATGGPFDVDIYPHLEEAPALMTLGADKQWETLGAGETKVITFFVEVAEIGTNNLWAQVDTSNYIAESDETNNVFGPITFEVCTGSDDFDEGLGGFWTRRNVGYNVNGSYAVNATGQLTMRSTGTRLFEINQNSSFYYIYQNYTGGDFDARLRLIQQPSRNQYSKIGLLVRAGTGLQDRYVMNMLTNSFSPAGAQTAASGVRVPEGSEAATSIPYWARIVRVGTQYAFYRSYAAEPTEGDWTLVGGVADTTPMNLIGVAHANYNSSASTGIVDDFILCPAVFDIEGGEEIVPPGLVQCEELLDVRSFEGNRDTVFTYWRAGEANAFRHTSEERYLGNFSMRLHASLGSYPCYDNNLDPYLYQDVEIPATDIYSITTLIVTGKYLVVGSNLQCSSGAADPLDTLSLEMRQTDNSGLVPAQTIVNGGSVTGTWQTVPITLSESLNLVDYAGQTVRLYWDGYSNGNFDGTFFYVDDVSAQACTMWPIPDPVPGTVSFGGELTTQVSGSGIRIPLTGASVWAYTQAGDTYQTTSIHDGTYHFYNLTEPGAYVVYAEAVVDGELRTAVGNVTLAANERNYTINMFLQ